MISYWLEGLKTALIPSNLLIMLIGAASGIVVGALPGVTSSMGIILLLPFTYYMKPETALLMLTSMYCASMFGGSISAILLRTPGTPSAAATAMDGYPLAQQGKAGKAISAALIGSFFGGLASGICMVFLAPLLAKFALKFGPPEYFALAVFGLTIIASVSGKDLVKGLIAGLIGLLLSVIGIDNVTGSQRLTLGIDALANGFDFLPVMIGVFAVSEVLDKLEKRTPPVQTTTSLGQLFLSWEEMKSLVVPIIVGIIIGTLIGVLPGTGGTIATFLAYNELKRWSKNKEKFGQGALEGVAVCETANNAVTGGAMVPTLSLGVPGDAVTAVMLGAFVLIGIRPGPLLFTQQPRVVYSFFAGWFIIQFMMLAMGFVSSILAPNILKIKDEVLMPIVLALCIIGSFSLRNSVYDVAVALCFGVLGYLMRKAGFPMPPLVLGMILGPMAEQNLNRTLLIAKNDWTILFRRPISLTLLLAAFVSVTLSLLGTYRSSKKEAARS
ncbi:C4-dicarboxylate ABC transporter permease [Thermotoga sp. Ku-13t]|uniref:tripartite tricarboxylate transporter permease n=1 Tax=Thermotoga sp. Ku-13t TaxID=1755813 RepID=UPI0013EC908C|nr:tripartite tricarboxylate transporter permease [Thermotoga sp. Ku-13t]KAF2958274.1 C4-dicarboxylate ABC transporter permease [Thermotoga sp. Ku-13t]